MNDTLPPIQQPMQHAPDLMTPPEKTSNTGGMKNLVATVLIVLSAPLMAILITSFVFQSYEVYGPSMQTTLENGDRLIVVKAPRTWAKLRGNTYMPKRGEIVVFTKLDIIIGAQEGNKQLIKRVMALPGERVVVKNGVLTVYSADRPEGFVPDKEADYGSVIGVTTPDVDVTVGEGQVFVSGDNRGNSLDSRSFGPIDTKDIVGTAELRFLPFKEARSF